MGMSEKRRIVFHLDMGHFCTAIGEREHPEYEGKPFVVGANPNEMEPCTEVKSISHETTFEEDTTDAKAVLKTLDMLSEEVCKEAVNQRLFLEKVTVKVRFENFETHTSSGTLPFMTNRVKDLKKTAKELHAFLRKENMIHGCTCLKLC